MLYDVTVGRLFSWYCVSFSRGNHPLFLSWQRSGRKRLVHGNISLHRHCVFHSEWRDCMDTVCMTAVKPESVYWIDNLLILCPVHVTAWSSDHVRLQCSASDTIAIPRHDRISYAAVKGTNQASIHQSRHRRPSVGSLRTCETAPTRCTCLRRFPSDSKRAF